MLGGLRANFRCCATAASLRCVCSMRKMENVLQLEILVWQYVHGQFLTKARPVLWYFLPGRCNLFARTAHVSQGLRKASACPRFATRLQFGKGLVARFAKGSGSPKVRANVVGARYSDKVCPSELVALSGSPIGIPAQKENEGAGHQQCGRAVRQSGD